MTMLLTITCSLSPGLRTSFGQFVNIQILSMPIHSGREEEELIGNGVSGHGQRSITKIGIIDVGLP